MAGAKLTPVGVVAKWVLVPLALGVGGFFLLGPRMGKILPSFSRHAPAITATPVAETDAKPSYAAPDVDVRSAPSLQPPEVEISARRHRKHRQHPVDPIVDNTREPVDAYSPPSQGAKPHHSIGTGDGI
jgi:hypothetical protein